MHSEGLMLILIIVMKREAHLIFPYFSSDVTYLDFLCEGANSLRIDTDTSFRNTVYKLDKTFPWTSRLYLGF